MTFAVRMSPHGRAFLCVVVCCLLLADSRTTLVFNIPLAEVVTDYFDQLKSRSKGYASMEYKITGYR